MDVEKRKLESEDRQAFEKSDSPRPGALGLRSRPGLVSSVSVPWLSHSMANTSSIPDKTQEVLSGE